MFVDCFELIESVISQTNCRVHHVLYRRITMVTPREAGIEDIVAPGRGGEGGGQTKYVNINYLIDQLPW